MHSPAHPYSVSTKMSKRGRGASTARSHNNLPHPNSDSDGTSEESIAAPPRASSGTRSRVDPQPNTTASSNDPQPLPPMAQNATPISWGFPPALGQGYHPGYPHEAGFRGYPQWNQALGGHTHPLQATQPSQVSFAGTHQPQQQAIAPTTWNHPPQNPPADVWGAINALTQVVQNLTANLDRQDNQSLSSEATSAIPEPKRLPTKVDFIPYFGIPLQNSTKHERDSAMMMWKLKYEIPLKQERNKQEVRAALRTSGILLSGTLDANAQDALISCVSRCEELFYLETEGSAYASTWAKQVVLRTEDAPAMASAHRAALLASKRTSSSQNKSQPEKNGKRRRRNGGPARDNA